MVHSHPFHRARLGAPLTEKFTAQARLSAYCFQNNSNPQRCRACRRLSQSRLSSLMSRKPSQINFGPTRVLSLSKVHGQGSGQRLCSVTRTFAAQPQHGRSHSRGRYRANFGWAPRTTWTVGHKGPGSRPSLWNRGLNRWSKSCGTAPASLDCLVFG